MSTNSDRLPETPVGTSATILVPEPGLGSGQRPPVVPPNPPEDSPEPCLPRYGKLDYVPSLLDQRPPLNPAAIRKIIIEQSDRARVGHIGSALSVADILAALYGSVLRIGSPDDRDRDRFILSKGHAALALYAALHLRGWISRKELDGFCADNSLLGVHPEFQQHGITM